ncbi:MAG: suppressor of fused domain protein [Oscillospiraceae bacterium]
MDEKDNKEFMKEMIDKLGEVMGKAAEKNGGKIPEEMLRMLVPAESLNTDYIGDFLDEQFPGGEVRVFHELLSERVHIDVFIKEPAEDRQFYVLMTSGMSDLPMTVPESFSDEQKAKYERAELMMFLPKDWHFHDEEAKDEKWYWCIRALKTAARYPHLCGSWIAHGHDIQFTEPVEPFAENTKLCALIFAYPLEERLRYITGQDGMRINVYMAVPIYEEEMNYKLSIEEDGGTALLVKLFPKDETPLEDFVVDINRKNCCLQ